MASAKPIRIVMADDSGDLCEIVGQAVKRRQDMELVGVAHDGRETLSLLRRHEPDVLLLDLIMPGLDGIGVLEQLPELGLPKRPKVIVFTSVSAESLANQVLSLGADYYIIKPFQPEMLCTRIWQVVHEPGKSPGRRPASLVEAVTRILRRLEVPPEFKGAGYLREAVLLVLEDERNLAEVTKRLYPEIGQRFGVSASVVERNLRHVIEHTWTYGNVDALYEVFGATVRANSGKPTNSSFIARLADLVRLSS
ncbi:MAG TPA: sporulation transcription factor Spo0A [Firmicutes bacterium]|nr:sporulation transcription factor Spo0A [Bacillota bacterium]